MVLVTMWESWKAVMERQVYTVEGNSGDAVKENSYTVHSASIIGYGIVSGM